MNKYARSERVKDLFEFENSYESENSYMYVHVSSHTEQQTLKNHVDR